MQRALGRALKEYEFVGNEMEDMPWNPGEAYCKCIMKSFNI